MEWDLTVEIKMLQLIDDVALRKTMGCNARKCAEERFNRKNTYPLLLNTMINSEKL